MKKNNINEELEMDMTTYKKVKGTIDPKTPVKITGDKPTNTSTTTSSTSSMVEENDDIEPKDKSTIKYLSNIRDVKTGKISQPFTIADKKYQMVRGISPNKEIVMGVFCHDELNENGENIIHPVKYFEENIVKPIIQQESMGDNLDNPQPVKEVKPTDKKEPDSLNLSEFKHYLVNEKNGKFRKFKNIVELAAAIMGENEKYMGIGEFKKFFESRVFGGKKDSETNIFEISTTGEESDEEMSLKAKKLMELIKKRIPSNIITTIKTPVAKREVIAAFAELIGVPRPQLQNLINGLKTLSNNAPQQQNSNTPISEKKVMSKAELAESLLKPNLIKTIKVKDIK